MKRYLWTASVLALSSVAAALPAQAQMTGFASAGVGSFRFEPGGGAPGQRIELNTLDASISSPLGSGLVLQTNLGRDEIDAGVGVTRTQMSFNVGMRNATWAAGAYLGGVDSSLIQDTGLVAGAEGLYYLPSTTISLGAGSTTYFDVNEESWGANAEVRHFFGDNMRVDAGIGYSEASHGISNDDNITSPALNVGGEWRFDNQPVSLFSKVQFNRINEATTPDDGNQFRFLFGLRFDFGSPNLKARDRSGPAFKPAAGLDQAVNTLF